MDLTTEEIDQSISPLYAAFLRTLNAFCASCSIHGLKYTRDENTNRIVRFVWTLISIVMFICAIFMVYTFYTDYRNHPTRLNVESGSWPVTGIYFPSVTICPEVLFSGIKIRNVINRIKYTNKLEISTDYLQIFRGFFSDDNRYKQTDIDSLETVLQESNLTLEQFANLLRWDCKDLIYRCRYKTRIVDCANLFQVSKTYMGHCCSFNLDQIGLNFTAKRASAGQSSGLSLILRYGDDNYKYQSSYSSGFKVLMQQPAAFPSSHSVAKFLPLNTESFVSVQTKEVFCSTAIKEVPLDKRECVFSNEHTLKYFPIHVYPNCEENCRASNMVKYCGCLAYFFNFNRTNDKICSFKDIPCLIDNFDGIVERYRKQQCNCTNNCEYFKYDVQITRADIQYTLKPIDPFYNGLQYDDAVVHIFLGSQFYRRIRRDLLSNQISLVANLGSAFSLFVGMSMISIIEIIYYFTVILLKYYRQELRAREQFVFRKNIITKTISNDVSLNRVCI